MPVAVADILHYINVFMQMRCEFCYPRVVAFVVAFVVAVPSCAVILVVVVVGIPVARKLTG